MAGELNTLTKDDLLRTISSLRKRIERIESLLQGQPITTVRIDSLSVSKLTGGTISVVANLGNSNVKLDGPNVNILINDGTNDRILIGKYPSA
jgi:hypothetical protein